MRFAVLCAVCLLISCVEPVCACSPPMLGMVLQGTLRSQAAVPQPGKRVRAEVGVGACATYFDTGASSVSEPDGRVTLAFGAPGTDSVCVRLFARDTVAGAAETPLVGPLRLPGGRMPFDTIAVALVLAP